MKKIFLILTIFLVSCFQRTGQLSSKVDLGMTKEQIVKKCGPPMKRSLHVDDHGNKIEVLYYKETTWDDGGWSWNRTILNNMFILRNNLLIAIEQGDEEHKQQIINRYLIYRIY